MNLEKYTYPPKFKTLTNITRRKGRHQKLLK